MHDGLGVLESVVRANEGQATADPGIVIITVLVGLLIVGMVVFFVVRRR